LRTRLVDLEDMTDDEVRALQDEFKRHHERAKTISDGRKRANKKKP